jgi:hypothetical protein
MTRRLDRSSSALQRKRSSPVCLRNCFAFLERMMLPRVSRKKSTRLINTVPSRIACVQNMSGPALHVQSAHLNVLNPSPAEFLGDIALNCWPDPQATECGQAEDCLKCIASTLMQIVYCGLDRPWADRALTSAKYRLSYLLPLSSQSKRLPLPGSE